MLSRILAENVRLMRLFKGLSQAELAEKARICRRAIQQIESGKGNASIKVLQSLAIALGVSPHKLFSNQRVTVKNKKDLLTIDWSGEPGYSMAYRNEEGIAEIVSDSFLGVYGRKPGTYIGTQAFSIVEDESLPFVQELSSRYKTQLGVAMRVVHKSFNGPIMMSCRALPVFRIDDGKFLGVLGYGRRDTLDFEGALRVENTLKAMKSAL